MMEMMIYPAIEDRELSERIFNDVGNIDYIYTVIQECVDEVTEEQYMQFNKNTMHGLMNDDSTTRTSDR